MPKPIDIATMKQACQWDSVNWCTTGWGNNKKDFMEANHYPITTEVLQANDIDKAFDEFCRGQDVEMTVSGHAVTIYGMAQLSDGNWLIGFQDDGKQGPIGNGGLRNKTSKLDPSQDKFVDGLLKDRDIINFVVECPKTVGGISVPVDKLSLVAPDHLGHVSNGWYCVSGDIWRKRQRPKKP